LRRAQDLCRATDVAWDALVMAMTVAQHWGHAVAVEAVAAGLITGPSDALYLELEELKQIATGEWHRGHDEEVQKTVAQRRAGMIAHTLPEKASSGVSTEQADAQPRPASPGQARGPAYPVSPGIERPLSSAVWLEEAADPGSAPFWLSARALVAAAADPWSPGMITARALGVPAVSGATHVVDQALPGQIVVVDGDAGRVTLENMV
jgi:phosphohistidine swiveling domain-containing protein